jgi:hypothetical protein
MRAEIREIEGIEGILDFWQGKTPCWQMCHCPEVVRNECPAPKYPSFPCWEIEGTYCKLTADGTSGRDISICQQCRVYKRWSGNQPIELKLFGKGIDSLRRALEEKAEIAPEEARAQLFSHIWGRRQEMQLIKLDKIIDRDSSNGEPLSKILRDIQDECEWSTKVYGTAIFSKGLNIIPRPHHPGSGHICVVELLKHYLDFLQHDLCGKCLPCREGMRQMYNIVSDITEGEGKEEDLRRG